VALFAHQAFATQFQKDSIKFIHSIKDLSSLKNKIQHTDKRPRVGACAHYVAKVQFYVDFMQTNQDFFAYMQTRKKFYLWKFYDYLTVEKNDSIFF
jgi:hypothetical protein